jgi:hypothetical protein
MAASEPTAPTTKHGFFSLRRGQMTPAERAQLDAALTAPETFQSTEKDGVLPWLILGMVASLAGMVAGLVETDWASFGVFVRSSDLGDFDNHLDGLGTIAALAVSVWLVLFFLRVHNRWGFVVLPHALGVIRGSRVRLIRIEDVAAASSRTVSPDEHRCFSALEVTAVDGSRRTFNAAGILRERLRDKLGPPAR